MKNSAIVLTVLLLAGVVACKKSADSANQVSLSASTTETTTGQTVSVTLNSADNASRWSVSPSTATKTYTVTTSKVNYFSFSQPGVYTVSVSTRALRYDSTHQSLDSLWNHSGSHSCTNGVDSASVKISVVK